MLEGFRRLSECPVLLGEILDVLYYNYDRIDFVDAPVDLGFECPLDLHCTYSRDQILAALDFMKPGTVREGTKYLPDKKTDVHFVTLNKAGKGLLSDDDVRGLLDKRGAVPLAEPEHDVAEQHDRSAVHESPQHGRA